MKLPHFVLAGAVVLAVAAPAFSQSLAVGTNLVALVFEDAGLPQSNRDRIAAELSAAFEWASDLTEAFETNPAAALGFGHVLEPFDLSIPSVLWNGIWLTNDVAGLRCRVTKALSDEHAARLAAFSGFEDQLEALRARILDANTNGFDAISTQEKADFFWRGGTVPDNLSPEQTAAFESEVVPLIRDYVLHPPSIFRLEGPKTIEGETAALCGWCVFVPRPGTNHGICAVPAGLVEGRWKFYFGM